jgi:uracil-DNA glycosylase
MDVKDVKIEESWKNVLQAEFDTQYFRDLRDFVRGEHIAEKPVYPKATEIFQAFNACPFDKVKVVILGQDPYHGTATDTQGLTVEQANGLSFAVHTGIPLPPSLKNIFKELQADLKNENNLLESGFMIPSHGHLFKWCEQGVFLLNSVLTVEEGRPGSHSNRGWEKFTDAVIQKINEHKEHIVFLLWGNYAKSKVALIDTKKHTVLTAPHPSPLSAHTGFLGCKHFSKTNADLQAHNLEPINWKL